MLKKSDIPEVSRLFVDSYKKEEKKRRWVLKFAEKYILNIYRLYKDICFVATENGKIIGVALCEVLPEYNKEVIVSKVLLVHPDFRRKKVGSKLLRKICIKAENKYDIKEIETSIYTLTNFPITWYESMGFRTKKHYETTRADIVKVLRIV